MDETYRRFHSGRFGTEAVEINYDTQIEKTKGVTPSGSKLKEVSKEMEKKEVKPGKEMTETVDTLINKYGK